MRRSRDVHQDDDRDDDDDVPLHHRKPFGAGLKRKRIEFVPAQQPDKAVGKSERPSNGALAGDLYASVVLGDKATATLRSKSAPAAATPSTRRDEVAALVGGEMKALKAESDEAATDSEPVTCSICMLPITTSILQHNASLAHQVSLNHSHPPSALDRSRMGLRTLESQGWNPDARRGLGREGEGLRYPIKTIAKEDTLGIGAKIPYTVKKAEKPRKMTAKELRLEQEREKRKVEELQQAIYGRVDVERYLRGDGGAGI